MNLLMKLLMNLRSPLTDHYSTREQLFNFSPLILQMWVQSPEHFEFALLLEYNGTGTVDSTGLYSVEAPHWHRTGTPQHPKNQSDSVMF